MGISRNKRNWSLRELADFELALVLWEKAGRLPVAMPLVKEVAGELGQKLSEPIRRRRGLKIWLNKTKEKREVSSQIPNAISVISWVFGLAAFFIGLGLVRGLLPGGAREFNLWVLLVAFFVPQLLLLLSGLISLSLVRKSGGFSILHKATEWMLHRFSKRQEVREACQRLLKREAAPVLGWRLGRISQIAGMGYNAGLLLGFIGVLWFLQVGFYWESTLPELSGTHLKGVLHALSAPWSWTQFASDVDNLVDLSKLGSVEPAVTSGWISFFVMALIIWGFLPRFLLWLFCFYAERRALRHLAFQDVPHRELWRAINKVDKSILSQGPADEAVLLEIGGLNLKEGVLRPFLLNRMRLNPIASYEAGVLDAERESEAFKAMKSAPMGVVIVAEGWNLSPVQMQELHQKVRVAIGSDVPLYFLITGAIREGIPEVPTEEELQEWRKCVDSLRDPSAEIVSYAPIVKSLGNTELE